VAFCAQIWFAGGQSSLAELLVLSREPQLRRLSLVPVGLLRRAAALGAATGLRSTVGLGVLAWHRSAGPSTPFVRTAVAAVLCTELAFDKLSTTPSRLDPKPLGGRVLFAGVGGAALARLQRTSAIPAAAVAAAAALTAARAGHGARVACARRMPDPVAAVVEDATAIWLAAWASSGCG
jgi:uncharacterized membrane protein